MILYNITINIDNEVHDEWMKWMKDTYIPHVLETKLFVDHKIFQLFNEEPNGGTTYAFQFFLKNREDYEIYQKEFDAALQSSLNSKFRGKFVDFKTLLKLV